MAHTPLTTSLLVALATLSILIPGSRHAAASELVWATNVGGAEFTGMDGTDYDAEASITGGEVRTMSVVKGSQDAPLYYEFREGDVRVEHAVPNGVYDVTLHFAEPDQIGGGERLFDTYIEDRLVIDDLDIMASRDGKVESALTVTIPDIEVSDGAVSVHFDASVRAPVLSAVAVRLPHTRDSAWRLTWSDEFDGDSLDLDKWSHNIWDARKVNDEDQAYTSRSRNIRLEDGLLVIEAHKEDYGDAKYTSARIHTEGKGDFLFGRFEIRAQLPRGMGSWPAIWMLPSDPYRYSTSCEEGEDWQGSSTCDAWPNSGEIDIMEHVGYQMGHVHGTVHNEAYYWLKWEQRKGRILLDDLDKEFHEYVLEWTPERIDIYLDDTLYFTYVNENDGWRSWPYDHPFNLILNVAVGGMWGRAGGGIDDSIFPQRMLVDYVRVYERDYPASAD